MYLNSKIIIQSDDSTIKLADADIENCKVDNNHIESSILEDENIEPKIRSRRSFMERLSETTSGFKKLYTVKKDKKKESESEYDIEAGIILIKEIMKTNNKFSKIIFLTILITSILFIANLFVLTIKSFYNETAIE